MLIESTYDQHPADREYGPTVLIVDDDAHARDRLNLALSQVESASEIHTIHAKDIESALDILSGTLVHVVLLDKNLGPEPVPAEQNGIESIPEMLRLQPQLQILMVTGSNDVLDVVKAIKYGAFGYVTKEMADALLIRHIEKAIQFAEMKLDKVRRERNEVPEQEELAGKSKAFLEVLWQSELLAESDRPILLTGESGTGKTALAKRIHARRGRFLKQKDRPFFTRNVATLSSELIESELFGHERGAFTGANETKQGLFELANNGTLFLDEIGELPLEVQPKLLTVIEEGTFMRVGGSKQLRSKPKLIFATNRNLEKMVQESTFRQDLYMRISMFTLRMPSLAERREDIPGIIKSVLAKACRDNRVQITYEELPVDFIEQLTSGSVDGNIRGILNQLDRLLVLCPREKSGQPILSKWRNVSGLYTSKREQKTSSPSQPLTYTEMMSRKWDVLGSDFPGFREFLDSVRQRLLDDAKARLGTNKNIARAFKMSESNISNIFKRTASQGGATFEGESVITRGMDQ